MESSGRTYVYQKGRQGTPKQAGSHWKSVTSILDPQVQSYRHQRPSSLQLPVSQILQRRQKKSWMSSCPQGSGRQTRSHGSSRRPAPPAPGWMRCLPAAAGSESAIAAGPGGRHLPGARRALPAVFWRADAGGHHHCAERVLPLLQVRDPIPLTITTYQTSHESSVVFDSRKALQPEQRSQTWRGKLQN